MRGLSLSNALFCESPFRRPSLSSPFQRGVEREFQMLQANCNQNIASIIMKNHFSETSFANGENTGHRKGESFQAASSIIHQFSRSSGGLTALTLCTPASNMQDILKFHSSGIRLRTNANERTSELSYITLLPSTYGTELKVLCL